MAVPLQVLNCSTLPCTPINNMLSNSHPWTDISTVLIPVPASVVITIWYWPASLPFALLTVRLRQLSEKEYLEVLVPVQERLTAPPIPLNTHWILSLITIGTGSFTMVKEMVTGSPMLIGLLLIPSEGATTGATAEDRNVT